MTHAYEDGLHGGQWVRRGAILRWVPSDAEKAGRLPVPRAAPEPVTAERPKLYDPMRLIACGHCGAHMTEPCRTDTGAARTPHAARLVSRVCKCGEKPYAPKARMCADCRDTARRRTWNDYNGRKRRDRERREAARGEQVAS